MYIYMNLVCAALFGVLTLLSSAAAAKEREEVDLLLCMASDVSGSINPHEFGVQRRGHGQAMIDPQVIDLILTGYHGQIAVAYVEWGDATNQQLIVGWTVIGSLGAAQEFAQRILAAPRYHSKQAEIPSKESTSITRGLDFCTDLFDQSPYGDRSTRRVTDVVGDGFDNDGAQVNTEWRVVGAANVLRARNRAVERGIIINGLVIPDGQTEGELQAYYERYVIGGYGSFVKTVGVENSEEAFVEALTEKLLREIVASR